MNIWKKLIKSRKCYMNFMVAKKIIFGILAILLLPTISIADQVTVSSYSYDISLAFQSDTQNHTYTGSGVGPGVVHSLASPYDYFPLFGDDAIVAGVGPFGMYVDTYNYEDDPSHAIVTAKWYFTPNSNKINLNIGGNSIVNFGGSGGWSMLSYSLFDTTDNHFLVNDSHGFAPLENPEYDHIEDRFDESFLSDVFQNHNYRLTLSAYVHGEDSINTTFGATFQPVPEPSAMLLLGSGLIGLAGYGRKKFFKE